MSDEEPEITEHDLNLDLLKPDESVIHFERRQDENKEFPDTYRSAQLRELPSGKETLSITLTLRQMQGWADTLGAKLSTERRRVGEDLAKVDEIYMIVKTHNGVDVETVGTSFTRNAAIAAIAELRDETDEPLSQEIELRTVPLFTD